jgi:hypothetical protein
VRLAERLREALERLREHAELLELDHDLALVEDAHDDLLAVGGGQRGDAQVDRLARDLERDAAVLRDAALGDVEVGEDLDARDDGGTALDGTGGGLLEHAVDAVADPHLVLAGSKWMSEAPRSTPSLITRCTSWMTDASSPPRRS